MFAKGSICIYAYVRYRLLLGSDVGTEDISEFAKCTRYLDIEDRFSSMNRFVFDIESSLCVCSVRTRTWARCVAVEVTSSLGILAPVSYPLERGKQKKRMSSVWPLLLN